MEKKVYWSGHRQRLKERVRENGFDALRPHEALELILFYAVPRRDMSEIARNLLDTMGSLHGVLYAPRDQLMAVPGVTRNMADWILMTRELVDAYIPLCFTRRQRLLRYRDVIAFLMPYWHRTPPPACWAIYTDFEDAVICFNEICPSLAWDQPENTRRMLRQGLQIGASHMILVEFIGRQPLEPEDGELDKLYAFARSLHNVEIELLDCVRVNEADLCSLNVDGRFAALAMENRVQELYERYRAEDSEAPDNI